MPDVPPPDPGNPEPRPATLWETVKAVAWSFFGVRRGDAMRRDMVSIRPLHVVIVGLAAAAALVIVLILIVRLITRNV